jgi:hypothetical protein
MFSRPLESALARPGKGLRKARLLMGAACPQTLLMSVRSWKSQMRTEGSRAEGGDEEAEKEAAAAA